MRRQLHWSFLGRVDYVPTAALQERLRDGVRSGHGSEHLLLLEHSPVFTLGRSASEADITADNAWLAQRGVEVHATTRGGQVTYHGPGQLVGYPIINLDPDRRDVRRYVGDLQEALIRTLADFGVTAQRREGQAFIGLWVEDAKIASIGVHLARWITIHGFALNVTTDLDFFDGIVACGLPEVKMTSLQQLLGSAPPLYEVAEVFAVHLATIFDRELVEVTAETLTL
jgi:lipoyl(octanoyl) transferase